MQADVAASDAKSPPGSEGVGAATEDAPALNAEVQSDLASEADDEIAVENLRATLDDPNKKWYVVNAHAGQEKNAASRLEDTVRSSDLSDRFGPILVPTEEVVELRGGKRRRSERRFYPGYIFVNMMMDSRTYDLVKNITRISGFVGATIPESRSVSSEGLDDAETVPKVPPLPKAEIQLILDRIDQGGEKVTPKTVFEPGELIRIIDGPFNEFSGTVEEVNYKKQQLVVAVTIFGRSTPVELDFSQVEKG